MGDSVTCSCVQPDQDWRGVAEWKDAHNHKLWLTWMKLRQSLFLKALRIHFRFFTIVIVSELNGCFTSLILNSAVEGFHLLCTWLKLTGLTATLPSLVFLLSLFVHQSSNKFSISNVTFMNAQSQFVSKRRVKTLRLSYEWCFNSSQACLIYSDSLQTGCQTLLWLWDSQSEFFHRLYQQDFVTVLTSSSCWSQNPFGCLKFKVPAVNQDILSRH